MTGEPNVDCEIYAPVQNLNLTVPVFAVNPGIIFGREHSAIMNLFTGNTGLVNRIGIEGIEELRKDPVFAIRSFENQLEQVTGSKDRNAFAHMLGTEVMRRLLSLWFVKDNSCYCPKSFYVHSNQTKIRSYNYDSFISNSRGYYATVDFTPDELTRAFELSEKLIDLFGVKDSSIEFERSAEGSGSVTAPDHKHFTTNRIERANLMLFVARSTVELSMKISFYMSTLECLFTTDNSEISNKIVQRVTLFVGGTREEQLKRKDIIRDAYSIRSGFLHGSNPKAKLTTKESLIEISTTIDEILRVVFVRIIEKEATVFLAKDSKILNDYFDSYVYK